MNTLIKNPILKHIVAFFGLFTTKEKVDPKDIVPMSDKLKEELRDYVRSKNMTLRNIFNPEYLQRISFTEAKKHVDNLIEKSNRHRY